MLAGLFLLPKICWGEEKNIIINEIQTAGEKSNYEFIELYNPTAASVDLTGFKLTKKTKSGTESTLVTTARFVGTVKAKGYFLISHPDYKDSINADLAYPSSYYISDDYTIILYDKSGIVLDKVGYGNASDPETAPAPNPAKSESIGRKDFIDTANNLNDFHIFTMPTPGAENKEKIVIPDPPKIYSSKIIINEILPKPLSGAEEFIEIYNPVGTEDLTGWKLEDRAKGQCELSGEIKAQDFLIVPGCKIKLNDTQGETLTLFNPNGEAVSFLSYDGSAKENKSYSFDGTTWHWSQFLTPGAENKFNSPPEGKTKKDNKIYVRIYADFQAKGSDQDHDKLKYTWDFGDGHKSYKAKTRHKYEKAGKYTVTLKISDGNEDKLETYKIKVEKFPQTKIKIIEVAPNPSGSDTLNEYITLENQSKKKVNLKDWSVATGAKNLYNHPITQDLFIGPGEKLKLTRDFSKFALNNKKADVELRYPDGKVAAAVQYGKQKESIQENEIYALLDKKWQWIGPKNNPETVLAQSDIPAQLPGLEPPAENTELKIADAEMQEGMGKYSGTGFLEKKENMLALVDYGSTLNSPENLFVSSGKVLGAEKIRETGSAYDFTNSVSNKEIKHNDIFTQFIINLNAWLNKFFF